MRNFIFKLQSVLDHRQKKEDILKKELAKVRLRYEEEKSALMRLREKLAELQQAMRTKQSTSVDVTDITAHSRYINKVQREIEIQIVKVTDLASEVRRAQERLLRAAKDKKVLENFKERKREEFKQEAERVEQTLIDELATVRHGRNDLAPLRSTNAE